MNLCIFTGNMVEDPKVETLTGSSGDFAKLRFRIGVNRRIAKDKSESTFPTIEATGKSAEMIGQYFQKGDLIRVFTHLKTDSWTDKESGETRYRDKYILDRFEFPETSKKRDKPAEGGEEEGSDEGTPEINEPTTQRKGRAAGRSTSRKPVGAGAGRGRGGDAELDPTDDDDDSEILF